MSPYHADWDLEPDCDSSMFGMRTATRGKLEAPRLYHLFYIIIIFLQVLYCEDLA